MGMSTGTSVGVGTGVSVASAGVGVVSFLLFLFYLTALQSFLLLRIVLLHVSGSGDSADVASGYEASGQSDRAENCPCLFFHFCLPDMFLR